MKRLSARLGARQFTPCMFTPYVCRVKLRLRQTVSVTIMHQNVTSENFRSGTFGVVWCGKFWPSVGQMEIKSNNLALQQNLKIYDDNSERIALQQQVAQSAWQCSKIFSARCVLALRQVMSERYICSKMMDPAESRECCCCCCCCCCCDIWDPCEIFLFLCWALCSRCVREDVW